jgi:hypothetical protein
LNSECFNVYLLKFACVRAQRELAVAEEKHKTKIASLHAKKTQIEVTEKSMALDEVFPDIIS